MWGFFLLLPSLNCCAIESNGGASYRKRKAVWSSLISGPQETGLGEISTVASNHTLLLAPPALLDMPGLKDISRLAVLHQQFSKVIAPKSTDRHVWKQVTLEGSNRIVQAEVGE